MPKAQQRTWKKSMKEDMRRIKLIKETQDHDRNACECEGCKWYNVFGTIIQNGTMYHVEQDWKKISPAEWNVSFMRFTKYRSDKKVTIENIKEKLLQKKQFSPSEIDKICKQILLDMVPHVVFIPTPQGVLREI